MPKNTTDPRMPSRDFAAIIADFRSGALDRAAAAAQLSALRDARAVAPVMRPELRIEPQRPDLIAVVGMAGQFPGARDVDQFWDVLTGERAVPTDRRLDGAQEFDPLFFRIAPREAEDMSLHQRLVLQESWKALEDAAIQPSQLAGTQTSVFVGAEPTGEAGPSLTGASDAIIAARLAYFLDLRGASLVVNTGCSSSATALHLACEALRHGQADLALAGGVFANLAPGIVAELARIGMVSPTGRCLSFDADADGTVLCEGVGMVVLKRLADAVASGDPIHGVIIASGSNQDGASNGITAPNGLAQAELIEQTYARFGLDAGGITYVEAHGTGTALGDPVEAKALVRAFGGLTDRKGFCRLGSAKAVVGHASAAAGVIGLIKILLCLKHRVLPGMPQFRQINPLIDLADSAFTIAAETAPWPDAAGQPLTAGLSAFGHSGTNVHLVIREPERPSASPAQAEHLPHAIPLSARTPAQLRKLAMRLRALVSEDDRQPAPAGLGDRLRHALAAIIGVDAQAIDLDDPLDDLGVQPAHRLRLRETLDTVLGDDPQILSARTLGDMLAAITPKPGSAVALADLAITLQQGRDARETRLVLFARNIAELRRLLDAFLAQDGGKPERPADLPGGLALCADRWLKGEAVVWPSLAGARRVHLPLWSYIENPGSVLPKPEPVPVTPASQPEPASISPAMPSGPILFAPVWDPVPGSLPLPERDALRRLIVIAEKGDARGAALRAQYPDLTLRAPGDLTLADLAADDRLCWLAPQRCPADPGDNPPVLALLSLVRALLAQGAGQRALEWTIVTSAGQATYADEPVDPHQAAVHGLAGTIAKEVAAWKFRVLDLPGDAVFGAGDAFLRMLSLPADRRGRSWAGRGTVTAAAGMRLQWRRQALVPVVAPAEAPPAYRAGAVYLVIGGAGDIGQVWSAYVIRSVGAQLVWVGRRQEDDTIRAAIGRLSVLGPAPLYLAADATDAAALARVRDSVKRRFGRIDGVVHSALAFFEQGVAELDDRRFLEGFLAKAASATHLAKVFAGEPLDFVLLFSSVVAQIKNARQAAYAAGCAFNDALAHELNRQWACPVKTINWGYWSSTKQQVADESAYQAFLRLADIGLGLIEPEEGMYALDVLLTGPRQQLGLVKTTRPIEIEGLDGASRIYLPETTVTVPVPSDPVMTDVDPVALKAQGEMAGLDPLLRALLSAQIQAAGIEGDRQLALGPTMTDWLAESHHVLAGHPEARMSADEAWQAWQAARLVWDQDPAKQAQADLVETALHALPAILRRDVQATDVLFPNGSMRLVENVHRHNPVADRFHQGMADLVIAALRHHRGASLGAARILEIGAGTGGTTAWVLNRLDAAANQDAKAFVGTYVYTDLSKAFLHHGAETFGKDRGFMQFEILNIEQPPDGQGFAQGGFDIVIAGNVLHATRDIRQTLRHAKSLLRPGGMLLACEVSQNALFTHLTFGLLDGWWLPEDPELRIPGCPGLAPSGWQPALQQEGFAQVAFPAAAAHSLGQQIILAVSDGAIRAAPINAQSEVAALSLPAEALPAVMPAVEVHTTDDMSRDRVVAYIQDAVGRSLKMPPADIDPTAPLDRYGMDSILAVTFAEALSADFPGVSSTLVFEHQTVAEIADHFLLTQAALVARLVLPAQSTVTVQPAAMAVAAPAPQPAAKVAILQDDDRIAVIGMSGRFPGAPTTDALWSVLAEGRNSIDTMPPERWSQEQRDLFQGDASTFHTRGGYMADIDCFDPRFFGISMAEAHWIDPRQRVFLEVAYHAFEDAGLMGDALRGSQCGVFVGVEEGEYGFLTKGRGQIGSNQMASLAARIAYFLDLHGPNFALSAACSSGLVAIHQACQSLRAGECDLALAGGVSLILSPVVHLGLAHGRMLSTDGNCRVFDAAASGMVPADAAGALVLKRLEDAIRDGDPIHGCIRASAVNYDGKTMGMATPNPRSQASLIETLYRRSGIAPEAIQFVLAHSVGSPLTDAVEVQALNQAYASRGRGVAEPSDRCVLGSIKPAVGHSFAASGVVSLIAMLLAMRHAIMPGTQGFATPHPRVALEGSPFLVDTADRPWPRPPGDVRRGAIGTSGLSGTNAHAVIEEFVSESVAVVQTQAPQLFVFSAHTAERLMVVLRQCEAALPGLATASLNAIAYSLQAGRQQLGHRLAFVAVDRRDLRQKLQQAQAVLRDGIADEAGWLYRGEPGLAPNPLAGLFAGPTATAFVAALIAEAALDRLALFWVQGGTVSWRDLHGAAAPMRVRLPGYPFLRERYWIPEEPDGTSAPAAAAPPAPAVVPVPPGAADEDLAALIRAFVASQLAMPPEMIADHVDWHDYGVDSIVEARLMLMLEEVGGFTLTGRELFAYPSVQGLAQHLKGQTREKPAPSSPHVPGTGATWPLSEGQQGLWMLEQLDPGTSAYNVPVAFRVRGNWNPSAFGEAVADVYRHFPILRAALIEADGSAGMTILPPESLDFAILPAYASPDDAVITKLDTLARQPFDLARGPLMRTRVWAGDGGPDCVLLVFHHLIIDGLSTVVLLQALWAAYEARMHGTVAQLPDPPTDYADFVAWEQDMLASAEGAAHRAYWHAQLADLQTASLASDCAPQPSGAVGRSYHLTLPERLSDGLRDFARKHAIRLSALFLSLYQALIARLARTNDPVIGLTAQTRPQSRFENTLGYFVNTLPIRSRIDPDRRFIDHALDLQQTVLDALDHASYPFPAMVRDGAAGDRARNASILLTTFSFQNFVPRHLRESAEISAILPQVERIPEITQTADDSLALSVTEDSHLYHLHFSFAETEWTETTIASLAGSFLDLAQTLIAHPESLWRDITPPGLIQHAVGDSAIPWPEDDLLAGFEQTARATPGAVAMVLADKPSVSMTYAALQARANQTAHLLLAMGIDETSRVGVCLQRSLESVVVLLAVLKCGATYVPISPDDPYDRRAAIIADAAIKWVVADADTTPDLAPLQDSGLHVLTVDAELSLAAMEHSTDPGRVLDPVATAYILFTSGSTGTPKGVAVSRRSLTAHITKMVRFLACGRTDHVLQFAPLHLDPSLEQVLVTLSAGARLIMRGEELWPAAVFWDMAREQAISVADVTPSYLQELLIGMPEQVAPSLRLMIVGGESFPVALCRQWRSSAARLVPLVNAYGPTETTITSTAFVLRAEDRLPAGLRSLPIGQPLAGEIVAIVDAYGQLVAEGLPGEIYIGGMGLALGYLNRPDLTADRFVAPPPALQHLAIGRWYRTGDLGRYVPGTNGLIECLGRLDRQVKIRGTRIELDDVAATLRLFPGLAKARVGLEDDERGGRQLTAEITFAPGEDIDAALPHLRHFITQRLAPAMRPAKLVLADGTQVVSRLSGGDTTAVEPSPLLAAMMTVWRAVLGSADITPQANFFDLGGHSLLAIRLLHGVEQRFGCRVPLSWFLQNPTVSALCDRVDNHPVDLPSPVQGEGRPLFFIHPQDGSVASLQALQQAMGLRPFCVVTPPMGETAEMPSTIEILAAHYVREIRRVQPTGPYRLAGWSFGGVLAFAAAQGLRALGQEIAQLTLIEAYAPGAVVTDASSDVAIFGQGLFAAYDLAWPEGLCPSQIDRLLDIAQKAGLFVSDAERHHIRANFALFQRQSDALRRYRPTPYSGDVTLIRADDELGRSDIQCDRSAGWNNCVTGRLRLVTAGGDHHTMLRAPHVAHIADLLAFSSVQGDLQGAAVPVAGMLSHSSVDQLARDETNMR